MYGAAVAGLVAGLGSGPAAAAPERLPDADLDRVVAGTVGDVDQLQQALIQTVFVPRLLAIQQLLAGSGSPVIPDVGALLELLEFELAPAPRTLGTSSARTANAAPGPTARSFRLPSGANVSILGTNEGGQPVIDISIIETADSASASVSISFTTDQAGSVRVNGVSATSTSGP